MHATYVDGYLDRSGNYEIFADSGSIISGQFSKLVDPFPEGNIVCFDVRKMLSIGLSRARKIYDVRLLHSHDGELSSLVRAKKIPSMGDFIEKERRFSAHTKAMSIAKIDSSIPLRYAVPDDVRIQYMNARLSALKELVELLTCESFDTYDNRVWSVFQDILDVESSKIKIDVPFVERSLRDIELAIHERRFLQHMLSATKDGFARTRISPVGSKTWRLRVEGGLNCMAIPHGVCRQAIVSRFDGGSIASLDFNAIDYRSLVDAINDPALNATYAGKDDFHAETASLFGVVDKALRDLVKKITYSHIYGSSFDSLQKTTGLQSNRLTEMLSVLDRRFHPISEFRKKLANDARRAGYLITPGLHRVDIEPGDHDGKIIGLFAQTYSSFILNRSLHTALEMLKAYPDNHPHRGARSVMIFTVHDEMVFDVHPDERRILELISTAVKAVTGFSIKIKEGKNYAEATY